MITIFGGTGFLGRHIAARLASAGTRVRVAVRHPEALEAMPAGVEAVRADLRDPESVAAAVAKADGVVNAVSAYLEKGGTTYAAIHEEGARNVARACAAEGVAGLAHISGIGADPASPSRYIRARGRGEAIVRERFPGAVIVRPSVLFGPQDAFLGMLADIARRAPVFLLTGGGARLQPVHAADVAEAVARLLGEPTARGRIYELGGPEILTLGEIVASVMARLGVQRPTLPVPIAMARIAATLAELLPNPPLSVAQVELLERDNVVGPGMPGFADLGIVPRRIEDTIADLGRPGS